MGSGDQDRPKLGPHLSRDKKLVIRGSDQVLPGPLPTYLAGTESEMSACLLRLTQSLLHSSVCTNILGLIVWGSLDSDNLNAFNVFILPILQLGMSAISEKIQRILRSRVNTDPSCLPASSEGQMSENRIKLRETL